MGAGFDINFDIIKKDRPQGDRPNRSPAKRVRFGEEERRNELVQTCSVLTKKMQVIERGKMALLAARRVARKFPAAGRELRRGGFADPEH